MIGTEEEGLLADFFEKHGSHPDNSCDLLMVPARLVAETHICHTDPSFHKLEN